MITPVELDLYVQRHAPFPSDDPFTLTDEVTGLPINLTGATITMQVRMYEGADGAALLDLSTAGVDPASRIVLTAPADGQFLPVVTEADHEALFAASTADQQTLQSRLKLRYDIKISPASGLAYIVARGFYYVQTGVVL